MAEGIIKRLTDKGYGFINIGKEKDLFFRASHLTLDVGYSLARQVIGQLQDHLAWQCSRMQ